MSRGDPTAVSEKGRHAIRAEIRSTDDLQGIRRLCIQSGLRDGDFDNVLRAVGCFMGRELVGCAVLRKDGETYSIDWLAVQESVRRMGIGSMLIGYVEGEARSLGALVLWAKARTPAFFRQLGYEAGDGDQAGLSLDDCSECDQFHKQCTPEIVAKRLRA